MAISRFSTSSVAQGLPKYQKLYDGVTTLFDSDYELIERVTVGSGGTGTITFSSIPSTYKNLQIRISAKTNRSDNQDIVRMRYNSDTGSNYAYHILGGTGSIGFADAGASTASPWTGIIAGNTDTTNMFGGMVTDIFDYANTNKYKTVRSFSGTDQNNANGRLYGTISNLWMSTSAIDTVTITPLYGTLFMEYSQFALYGIKGAA